MSSNTLAKIKSIVAAQLGVDEDEVTPSTRFIDDLGADSLDSIELIMAFEEEFETEISDEEAEKLQTVNHVIKYIQDQKVKSS